MLLNNEWVNNEIKEEIKKYLETNANEDTTTENLSDTAKQSKREIYSITVISQETRKSSNKQSNFTLTGVWKEQQTKPKVHRRKKIIKIST